MNILDKREEKAIEEQIKNMPEDCKRLYKKFSTLRKQTKDLKQDLVKIAPNLTGGGRIDLSLTRINNINSSANPVHKYSI